MDTSVWVKGLAEGMARLEFTVASHSVGRDYAWTDKVKFTVVDPPTIEIVAVDPDTKELNPNELCRDDPAMFLLTRTGSLLKDITVHLQYSGTADPEDYYVNGAIATESVVIPAGRSDVAVRLQALHDDMTADPDYDPETAIVEIVAPPDGSYVVGAFSSQTSDLYDTSDWDGATENPQRKPFPEYLFVHHTPPTSGCFYTVVIVMGGALDGAGNERDLWARQTYDAFPSGTYVYNDCKNVFDFADVLLSFPENSITRLVLGGHGTSNAHVGLQPTNNNTVIPPGYGDINDATIADLGLLDPDIIPAIEERLEASAIVDIQSCGNGMNADGAKNLYNTLQRQVRYAVGSVDDWNTKPKPYGPPGVPLGGYWAWYPE